MTMSATVEDQNVEIKSKDEYIAELNINTMKDFNEKYETLRRQNTIHRQYIE